jgi:hypothetical protein
MVLSAARLERVGDSRNGAALSGAERRARLSPAPAWPPMNGREKTTEPTARYGVIAAGTRRVSTGRNGDRWTQLILPVSNCGSNASVRVGI